MSNLKNNYESAARFGLHFPKFLLPTNKIDLNKWSVVACDQFTSEPEYWEQVKNIVGDAPSTLHLVLPEVYLENPGEQPVSERIKTIRENMNHYLQDGTIFRESEPGIVVIRRLTSQNKVRTGLVAAIDLDTYEFAPGNQALTRASEATVAERIPPRLEIRAEAPLESAHILLLIDDPERQCIEPFADAVFGDERYETCYDFDLMTEGGKLSGRFVPAEDALLTQLLENMGNLTLFTEHGMMFAVGDGNHSLATAKALWEKLKSENPDISPNHPARYAMVEIEALNDPGLLFEPIHQVVFETSLEEIEKAAQQTYGADLTIEAVDRTDYLNEDFLRTDALPHAADKVTVPVISGETMHLWHITSGGKAAIEKLRFFLDPFVKNNQLYTDYIHGDDVLTKLSRNSDNVGFYLPALEPSDFFAQIIQNGILPRKTFSLGDAIDKRFYMECRKIRE